MQTTLLLSIVLFALAVLPTRCQIKIVHTNDDGWAVANIRAQNTALRNAGFNVVMSAPAQNESGTSSSDAPPTPVGASGCEFDSCPPDAPATGSDPSDPRLNYVNSFPVTAVRFGIQTASPPFFNGSGPDFVVSGPNVGTNLGSGTAGPVNSGTVGAACEAAKEGFPSVAISGGGGAQVSFTTLSTPSASTTTANTFAVLGVIFTQALLAQPFNSSSPILPTNVTINLNYPDASGPCTDPSAFDFILTRVTTAQATTPPDVETCGTTRLPTEASVIAMTGCHATVSVMDANTKVDVDASTQQFVLNRLESFLSCL